jgi:hypothetical protein
MRGKIRNDEMGIVKFDPQNLHTSDDQIPVLQRHLSSSVWDSSAV